MHTIRIENICEERYDSSCFSLCVCVHLLTRWMVGYMDKVCVGRITSGKFYGIVLRLYIGICFLHLIILYLYLYRYTIPVVDAYKTHTYMIKWTRKYTPNQLQYWTETEFLYLFLDTFNLNSRNNVKYRTDRSSGNSGLELYQWVVFFFKW